MRLDAGGFLQAMGKRFTADPYYCVRKIQQEIDDSKKAKDGDKKRLTLQSLSAAFIILGIGYVFSTLAFICEVFYSRIKKNKLKRRPAPARR